MTDQTKKARLLAEDSFSWAAMKDTILQLCDALEASPWISVDERLPAKKGGGQKLLVGFAKHGVAVASFGNYYGFKDVHTLDGPKPITHWMPIPPLPEDTSEDTP